MAEKAESSAVSRAGNTARKLHGTAQLVRGAVTADFVAVVNGVTKVLSPHVILAIIGVITFFALLPLLVIFSIPQALFNWETLADDELILRHEHSKEIVQYYNEASQLTSEYLDSLTEGVTGDVTIVEDEDDIIWLIAIDAVRNNQDIMKINKDSIKELIKKSYSVSSVESGDDGELFVIKSKDHHELMNELGFDGKQQNWAELMVKTVKDAAAEGDIDLPITPGGSGGSGGVGGGGGVNNGVPADAYNDATFAQLMQEAEKYLGYPYVFGGSSPSTSFDCSGFVCWVYTHSGVHNLPRTTAQGIYDQCTRISREEAKPGDLVFFQGTYNAGETVTHIGIYVGNGRMLHCGNPIQYTSIETTYWTNHFYAFGRLS